MTGNFQLSAKANDGRIYVVAADTYDDFYGNLVAWLGGSNEADAALKDGAALLSGTPADFAQATTVVQGAFPQAQAVSAGAAPSCQHGPRTYKEANAKFNSPAKWACTQPPKLPSGEWNPNYCRPVPA